MFPAKGSSQPIFADIFVDRKLFFLVFIETLQIHKYKI